MDEPRRLPRFRKAGAHVNHSLWTGRHGEAAQPTNTERTDPKNTHVHLRAHPSTSTIVIVVVVVVVVGGGVRRTKAVPGSSG